MGPLSWAAPAPALPALAVRGLTRRYGAVTALDDVDLTVAPASLHALVGANGSGKSTLIRVVAGVEVGAPGGTVAVGGVEWPAEAVTPAVARAAGVRVVHQASTAFPTMSVAENVGIASTLPIGRLGRVDRRRLFAEVEAALDRLDLDVSPRAPMATLSPARQTLVAVARALADAGPDDGVATRLLVLDEPTAALPAAEVDVLLAGLAAAVGAGHAVLLVTHRLDEVRRAADAVTVLRDGRVVADLAGGAADEAGALVGRTLPATGPRTAAPTVVGSPPLLVVDDLAVGGLDGVSLTVGPGEVAGVAGLLGSGRSTLVEALFGARPWRRGTVRLADRPYAPDRPVRAVAAGVALVPENRERSVFAGQTVADNLGAAGLDRRPWWRRDRRAERRAALADLAAFGVVAAGPEAPMASLSGGNQQKVVLARWLRGSPRLLLLDEPTLGVDVGARAELHALIRAHVTADRGALVVSSDADELCRLADRVLVLRDGRVAHEVAATRTTPTQLDRLVHGEVAA